LIPFVRGTGAANYPEVKRAASTGRATIFGRRRVAFDRSPVSQGEIAIGYADEVFDHSGLATLAALTSTPPSSGRRRN